MKIFSKIVLDFIGECPIHITLSFSREKQAGFFAMIPASGNMFLSAEHIGSDEDVHNWQEHMHSQSTETLARVNPALRSGLEKQYAIQRELFASKEQAQAEYVYSPLIFVAERMI